MQVNPNWSLSTFETFLESFFDNKLFPRCWLYVKTMTSYNLSCKILCFQRKSLKKEKSIFSECQSLCSHSFKALWNDLCTTVQVKVFCAGYTCWVILLFHLGQNCWLCPFQTTCITLISLLVPRHGEKKHRLRSPASLKSPIAETRLHIRQRKSQIRSSGNKWQALPTALLARCLKNTIYWNTEAMKGFANMLIF